MVAKTKITKPVKVGTPQSQVASIPNPETPRVVQSQVGPLSLFDCLVAQLDTKPAAGVSSTLPQSDEDHDDSTVEVDYQVTDEETCYHTCCIHCPLLKKYIQLHGRWPPEPATNKEAKTAPDSHPH